MQDFTVSFSYQGLLQTYIGGHQLQTFTQATYLLARTPTRRPHPATGRPASAASACHCVTCSSANAGAPSGGIGRRLEAVQNKAMKQCTLMIRESESGQQTCNACRSSPTRAHQHAVVGQAGHDDRLHAILGGRLLRGRHVGDDVAGACGRNTGGVMIKVAGRRSCQSQRPAW